jgi:CRP/FNR family transcriptional regulator, cyclic AMP receptor protein
MTTNYLEHAIVEHPFLTGINPRFIHLLEECATCLRFDADQKIFKERGDADHLYLIVTGQVAIETFVPGKGNVTIQTLGAGEAVGWSWLFPPYHWQFTARTLEPTEVIALGAAGLRERAEENRDFGHDLLMRVARVLLQRLQATRKRLVEYYEPLE